MLNARLIVERTPLSGEENMRRDLKMLEDVENGNQPATLRLYRWALPTVSLGRFQKESTVDLDYALSQDIEVVRRPTGGKGVLHNDELTYSFAGSLSDGIPKGVEVSYEYLSRALHAAFTGLGVHFSSEPPPESKNSTGACYLNTTPADLAVTTNTGLMAKLSGSAQVWQGETVLQHGSFVRTRSIEQEASLFMLDAEQKRQLATQAISLDELLGVAPSFGEIEKAAIRGFADTLDISFS